jgi:polar amino acid transport system permease protein
MCLDPLRAQHAIMAACTAWPACYDSNWGNTLSYIDFVAQYGPRLLSGAWITLQMTMLSALLAITIAGVLGLARLAHNAVLRGLAIAYIEFFRGTSLLVQLFWIFFVLPLFGLSINASVAGVIGIGMNLGAYGAEVVRGAIQAVPRGQWEAATALNLSPLRRMWRIILPQALLNMLPAWGNLMIEVMKATALVSLISVTDLMYEARQINGLTYLSTQTFGTALVVYYAIARFGITPMMRGIECLAARKLGRI